MDKSIEMEIVRLVKEIAKDEEELRRCDRLGLTSKIPQYTRSLDRKLDLIKILKS